MDINIKGQRFLVCGATSGFGRAVAEALLQEGALIAAVARTEATLVQLRERWPDQVQTVAADLTAENAVQALEHALGTTPLHGILVNAGGPPAMKVLETTMRNWDEAYRTVFRWKVELVNTLLPAMISRKYGRVLFIESVSVKQPIENLVLSNAMRLAVIGYMKSLSREVAASGVTLNTLAPGYHDTPAIDRLVQKKMEQSGKSEQEVRELYARASPVGGFGSTADFASLSCWLLSPASRFITGQTISVDGGVVQGVMG